MDCIEEMYLEHENTITNKLSEIKHVDLWHEQISFLQEEHPFKAPAVFFAYRSNNIDDLGNKIQDVGLQVDIYYYYETFADTARGSKKQNVGLNFLKMISKINACFHGTSGTYFREMRRVAFAPVETGTASLLYVQRYHCHMIDASAKELSNLVEVNDVEITNVEPTPKPDTPKYYDLDVE